jgi:hypothetical protein
MLTFPLLSRLSGGQLLYCRLQLLGKSSRFFKISQGVTDAFARVNRQDPQKSKDICAFTRQAYTTEVIKLANIKSAKKRIRQIRKRTAHNRMYTAAARTYVRKTRELIATGDLEAAEQIGKYGLQNVG